MISPRPFIASAFSALLLASTGPSPAAAVVQDIFGRDLTAYGVVVPDWEGYMGNPAIELLISPPPARPSP